MDREQQTQQRQQPVEQQPQQDKQAPAASVQIQAPVMASLLSSDVQALLGADPEQIKALSHIIGNAAVAALLRGDVPLASVNGMPRQTPGDSVNQIRTSPPALRDRQENIAPEGTVPNRLQDMAEHMGIY